jgi:DNA invertase Pin-like site-specific DNA recombinase
VVWKLDRLGREMLRVLHTVNELTVHGFTLVSVMANTRISQGSVENP